MPVSRKAHLSQKADVCVTAKATLLLSTLIVLAGCGGGLDVAATAETASAARVIAPPQLNTDYRVSIGDKVFIRIKGQEGLSGAVPVGENGTLSHPRLGTIQSIGLTVATLEAALADRLDEAKIEHQGVDVSVLNLRAIYVIGEVHQTGEYPYFEGLRIKEAIEDAGGYTYRADESRVFVTRFSLPDEAELPSSSVALPGDIIRVPQRYF